MPQHYKDLIVWQKAMDLVNAIYDATDTFPKRETYSLTDQIRAPPSPFQAILRKDKLTTVNVSSFTSFVILAVRLPNLKLK